MTAILELPGVGPAMAAELERRFGGNEGFLAAAKAEQVAAIAAVPGVGPKRARKLIAAATGRADPRDFLATEAAERLWERTLAGIQSHAGTDAGKARLSLLGPCAKPKDAAARARDVIAWKQRVAGWHRDAARAALQRLKPLREVPPRRATDHVVVCDRETGERLERLGLDRWIGIEGPEFLEQRDTQHLILLLGEADCDAPNVVPLSEDAGIEELAPDAVLAWFQANEGTIRALQDFAEATGKQSRALDVPALIVPSNGRAKPTQVAALVEEERAAVQAAIRAASGELQLSGQDLLDAMESKVPAAMQQIIAREVAASHDRLRAAVGVPCQPFAAELPIRVDEDEVRSVKQRIEADAQVGAYEAAASRARILAPLRSALEAEWQDAMELDANFALGCYALERDLQTWTVGPQLVIHDGVHLDLDRDTAQSVHYELGAEHPVALLTGANSGGKTTLLEMLAQIVTMARFGLPVPGHATIPWYDELHLIVHRRSLNAGAFEAFLRRFIPLGSPGPQRLVLADEVEAMTELQAASRIVSFFLKRLAAAGHHGLFVTHMAAQIMEEADVRVDGIQSTGLDEAGELLVDRSPRMGCFATSTPELILERLRRQDETGPWADLLAAVQGKQPRALATSPQL